MSVNRQAGNRTRKLLFAVVAIGALLATLFTTDARAQTVPNQPEFGKSFSPTTVGPGNVSTLVFTINVQSVPIDNFSFTDTLPAGMTIANPSSASSTCFGTVVDAPPGGTTISVTNDERQLANATCQISVNVIAPLTPDTYTNTSSELTTSLGTDNTATANLIVDATRATFSKAFDPVVIPPGGVSTMTLVITNPGGNAFNGALTDIFPDGMRLAEIANLSTDCIGSVSSTVNSISLFNLAILGAGSCQVSVDVTADTPTFYDNVATLSGIGPFDAGKATARLSVANQVLTKAFVDDPVVPGGTTELVFTLRSDQRVSTMTNIAFSDTLPAGLTFNSLLSNDCGGVLNTVPPGVVGLFGGTLAAESTCEIRVLLDVPGGTAPGEYLNATTTATATVDGEAVVYPLATDVLRVAYVPTFTKEFLDAAVASGGSTTLRFTIVNTSPDDALTAMFQDRFPEAFHAEAAVTGTPDLTNCTGSVAPLIDGGGGGPASFVGINVTALTVGAGATCTIDIPIDLPAGNGGGEVTNTTGPLTGDLNGEPVGAPATSDSITIVPAPRLEKAFDPEVILPGGTTTLTFTLTNAAGDVGGVALTDVAFTDDTTGLAATLDTVLPFAACGGILDVNAGVLEFTGGTLAIGETCEFSVDLTNDGTLGVFTNTTSTVTATGSGITVEGQAATDDLLVTALTVTKEFLTNPVRPGDGVTLRFTVTNDGGTDATAISFTDALPTGITIDAAEVTTNDVCGAGSAVVIIPTTLIALTGGSVTAGNNCIFDVDLDVGPGIADGEYINNTSQVAATVGGVMVVLPAATDTLVVERPLPPVIEKRFQSDTVAPGDTLTMELTITNPNDTEAFTTYDIADDLDAALTGLTATGATNGCNGMGNGFPTTNFLFSGVNLNPGDSCTITLFLDVPAGATPGTYTNTTGQPEAEAAGFTVTGLATSADFTVVEPAPLAMEVGRVLVDDDGVAVEFEESYVNPIIVAGPAGTTNPDPVTVIVGDVRATGFELKLKTFPNQPTTGAHGPEWVSYLVVEAGEFTLPSGAQIVAGTTSLNDPGAPAAPPFNPAVQTQLQPVDFGTEFGTAPLIMATVASEAPTDLEAVVVRIDDITTTGFNAKLREAEAPASPGHPFEDVNFVAWEPGSDDSLDPVVWEVFDTRVNSNFAPVAHSTGTPCVLSQMVSLDGANTGWTRHRFIDEQGSVEIKIEEEQSLDAELFHGREDVAVFAFGCDEPAFDIRLFETSATVAGTRVNVDLTGFDNPIIVAGPPTSNSTNVPMTVVVESVDDSGFDLRLTPFPNQPPGGVAAAEDVTVLIVEAGSHTLDDGTEIFAGSRLLNDPGVAGPPPFKALVESQMQPTFFGTELDMAPAVVATVIDPVDPDTVEPRIGTVGEQGFEGKLHEAEAPLTFGHPDELVNFIAISTSDDPITIDGIPAVIGVDGLSSAGVAFEIPFFFDACFLSQINGLGGANPSWMRRDDSLGIGAAIGLFIEEEQSLDAEVLHGVEQVALMAFDCGAP